MAKMIRIQSDVTITVTCGLQHKDVTNPDAHVADRLKVSAEWPRHTVLIRQGAHFYPAEIKDWNSVKALANDKVLTLGEEKEIDESQLSEEEAKFVNTAKEAKEEFETEDGGKRRRRRSLGEIAGEENDA